jgi:hypothetical protein
MAGNPNSSFPTQTVGPTAAYPYGAARDITVTGDGTGTPWNEQNLNDIYGFQQAMLWDADIVPSGSPDEVGASQYLEALKKIAGFPGTIVATGFNEFDPATLGVRLLGLNGGAVLVADYLELVDATYVGDTENAAVGAAGAPFYKSSDELGTTPNVAGPWFQLPDSSGRFLRGVDNGEGIDPDGDRMLGADQLDCAITHEHGVVDKNPPVQELFWESKDLSSISAGSDKLAYFDTAPNYNTEIMALGRWKNGVEITAQFYEDSAGNPTKTIEEESRPRNIAVRYAIWY